VRVCESVRGVERKTKRRGRDKEGGGGERQRGRRGRDREGEGEREGG
jgi:hypothetical protein